MLAAPLGPSSRAPDTPRSCMHDTPPRRSLLVMPRAATCRPCQAGGAHALTGDVVPQQGTPDGGAAVNHQHAALALLLQGGAHKRVGLEALDGGGAAAEAHVPAEIPEERLRGPAGGRRAAVTVAGWQPWQGVGPALAAHAAMHGRRSSTCASEPAPRAGHITAARALACMIWILGWLTTSTASGW